MCETDSLSNVQNMQHPTEIEKQYSNSVLHADMRISYIYDNVCVPEHQRVI